MMGEVVSPRARGWVGRDSVLCRTFLDVVPPFGPRFDRDTINRRFLGLMSFGPRPVWGLHQIERHRSDRCKCRTQPVH